MENEKIKEPLNVKGSLVKQKEDAKARWLHIGLVLLKIAASSLVLMYLWNWIAVDVFGAVEISYIQAVGLKLLTRALFQMNRFSEVKDGKWTSRRMV